MFNLIAQAIITQKLQSELEYSFSLFMVDNALKKFRVILFDYRNFDTIGIYTMFISRGIIYHFEMSDRLRKSFWDQQYGMCYLCNEFINLSAKGYQKPTIDHIIPLSKGGSRKKHNLKLAHECCNALKADRIDYWNLDFSQAKSIPYNKEFMSLARYVNADTFKKNLKGLSREQLSKLIKDATEASNKNPAASSNYLDQAVWASQELQTRKLGVK